MFPRSTRLWRVFPYDAAAAQGATVVFHDRLHTPLGSAKLVFGIPEPFKLTSAAVTTAARRLSISVATS
ncbi:MAG: hypothetical protein ACR2KM_10560 [Gemmatimonadaceae bacterium]